MSAVEIILIITLLYAFSGPFSFIAYILGLFMSILRFPLDIIGTIYPIGVLPYVFLTGVPVVFFAIYILKLIKIS